MYVYVCVRVMRESNNYYTLSIGDGISLTMFTRYGTQTITKLIAGSGSYMGVSKMITAAS